MRVALAFVIILFHACELKTPSPLIAETEMAQIPCIAKTKFNFRKLTGTQDSLFLEFIRPIDSINELIHLREIKPQPIRTVSGTGVTKLIWRNNEHIIKIKNTVNLNDKPYFRTFYVEDNCRWFSVKEEHHQFDCYSFVLKDLYYFNDSTVLNILVGIEDSDFKVMASLDSNNLAIQSAKQMQSWFYKDKALFE